MNGGNEISFAVTPVNTPSRWEVQFYKHGYLDNSIEPLVSFTLSRAPDQKRATLHNLATALLPLVKEFYADD